MDQHNSNQSRSTSSTTATHVKSTPMAPGSKNGSFVNDTNGIHHSSQMHHTSSTSNGDPTHTSHSKPIAKADITNIHNDTPSLYSTNPQTRSVSGQVAKRKTYDDIINKARQAKLDDARDIYETQKIKRESDQAKDTRARLAFDNAARGLAQTSRADIDNNAKKLFQDMEKNFRASIESDAIAEIREKVYDDRRNIESAYEREIKDITKSRLIAELEPVVKATLGVEFEAEIRQQLKNELDTEVRAELSAEYESEVREQLREEIEPVVKATLAVEYQSEVREQLRKELSSDVEAELNVKYESEVRAQLRDELRPKVKAVLSAEYESELRQRLWDELESKVRGELRDILHDQVKDDLREELTKDVWEKLECDLAPEVVESLQSNMRRQDALYNTGDADDQPPLYPNVNHQRDDNYDSNSIQEAKPQSDHEEGEATFATAPEQDADGLFCCDLPAQYVSADGSNMSSLGSGSNKRKGPFDDEDSDTADNYRPLEKKLKVASVCDLTQAESSPPADGNYKDHGDFDKFIGLTTEEVVHQQPTYRRPAPFADDDDDEDDFIPNFQNRETAGVEEDGVVYKHDHDNQSEQGSTVSDGGQAYGRGVNVEDEVEENVYPQNPAYPDLQEPLGSHYLDARGFGNNYIAPRGLKRSLSADDDSEDEDGEEHRHKRFREYSDEAPEDEASEDDGFDRSSEEFSESEETQSEEDLREEIYDHQGQDAQRPSQIVGIIKETNTQETAFNIDDSDEEDQTLVEDGGLVTVLTKQEFRSEIPLPSVE